MHLLSAARRHRWPDRLHVGDDVADAQAFEGFTAGDAGLRIPATRLVELPPKGIDVDDDAGQRAPVDRRVAVGSAGDVVRDRADPLAQGERLAHGRDPLADLVERLDRGWD